MLTKWAGLNVKDCYVNFMLHERRVSTIKYRIEIKGNDTIVRLTRMVG